MFKLTNRLDAALGSASRKMESAVFTAMSLAKEDKGWLPWGQWGNDEVLSLEAIKDHTKQIRALMAFSPLVKRGLVVRNGYMWTDPMEFLGESTHDIAVIDKNRGAVFSPLARARDEESLVVEGCVIYLVDPKLKCAYPIPLAQLSGLADDSRGGLKAALITFQGDTRWYPVGKQKHLEVESSAHPVDMSMQVVYVPVNALVGSHLGKPDLLGAVYYARAYKEALETGHLLMKALARIAYRATSVNARQQKAVTEVMGRNYSVGGTVNMGAGQSFEAVSKAGASVDYSASTPLAAMVAAALDVPLSVLLTDGSAGGRQGAETALEDPTFKAIELRRLVHKEIVARVAEALEIVCDWRFGGINNDQTHRRIQSLALAFEGGAIHQEEFRAATLQVLKVPNAKAADELPELPEPTKGEGVGPLSDGTNDNRDNPTEA